MKFLLDTHILLWWLEGAGRLSRVQQRLLDDIKPGAPFGVAGISLWEIAMLHSLGRIALSMQLREWLQRAVAPPLVQLFDLTPAIAAEVANLPDSFHRDPADRILVATARVYRATLVTSDGRITGSGLVETAG